METLDAGTAGLLSTPDSLGAEVVKELQRLTLENAQLKAMLVLNDQTEPQWVTLRSKPPPGGTVRELEPVFEDVPLPEDLGFRRFDLLDLTKLAMERFARLLVARGGKAWMRAFVDPKTGEHMMRVGAWMEPLPEMPPR